MKRPKPLQACVIPGCRAPGVDSHHITPLEYGGPKDGAQIKICATHHDTIHRFASEVYQGGRAAAEVPEAYRGLVMAIVKARWNFTKSKQIAPDARNTLAIRLLPQEKALLLAVKNRLGSKNAKDAIMASLSLMHKTLKGR